MTDCSTCTLDDIQALITSLGPGLRGHVCVCGEETLCVAELPGAGGTAPHFSREYLRRILDRDAGDLVDVPDEALLFEELGAPAAALVHSPVIAGLACSRTAESVASAVLAADGFLPFTAVASELRSSLKALVGTSASGTVVLGNRGLLVWAEGGGELSARLADADTRLRERYAKEGMALEAACPAAESDLLGDMAPRLRSVLGTDEGRAAVVAAGFREFPKGGLLADHLPLGDTCFCERDCVLEDVEHFSHETGVNPRLVAVFGECVFFAGRDLAEARSLRSRFAEVLLTERLAEAFGGPDYLSESECRDLRRHSRCASCECCSSGAGPRLASRICLVTGAAQGFGWGIARGLAAEGATVIIADLNAAGAREAADRLNGEFGVDTAFSLAANIAEEASVQAMVRDVVAMTGGLDLLVANAGVLKAGSVKELDKQDWDLVTNVNYTGYFLCAKHCSQVMSRQWQDGKGPWMDIIQINSKSGLEGSNRNGAYAGSKFGTIGLTQSFAKELVEDRIKVNSICPGNFFDGPLWSDPEKGLFVQYLNTGKVPGAETIEDVKRFYESKVPMGRGCTPADVVNAILYLVDQEYETGQAVPVTGGQVMLN